MNCWTNIEKYLSSARDQQITYLRDNWWRNLMEHWHSADEDRLQEVYGHYPQYCQALGETLRPLDTVAGEVWRCPFTHEGVPRVFDRKSNLDRHLKKCPERVGKELARKQDELGRSRRR